MSWDGPLERIDDAIHEIPADYRGKNGDLRMRVPGRIVADDTLLAHIQDDLAPEQVANVASLPGIVGHAWAMPDIHWGYGFPIGGVAAFGDDGVVSPGGVGFDINCGVRLLATDRFLDDARKDLPELMDALFRDVPAGMGSRGKDAVSNTQIQDILSSGAAWAVEQGIATAEDRECMEERGHIEGADPSQISDRSLVRGKRSLGSLGSGNHFLEVQAVQGTWGHGFGLEDGQLVIMIHTGSRGLGHQVCQEHVAALQDAPKRFGIDLVDRQLACAPVHSDAAQAYLGAMAAAANFAFVNRSILADRARQVLDNILGGTAQTVYDVCHNIAKWEDHDVDGRRQRLLVHRKGATRALPPGDARLPPRYQETGQPVIVPGDMGRQSFLLSGQAGSAQTFHSSCHGAGRRLSRTAAKKQFEGRSLIQELAKKGIIVKATSETVAAEEAPLAYKDVAEVVSSVETAGLATRAACLKPLGVVKG